MVKISCKVIIETPWGILLVKDALDPRKRYALPGGQFERKHGDFEHAAVTEVYEELKLAVKRGKIKELYSLKAKPLPDGTPHEMRIFVAKVRNSYRHGTLKRKHLQTDEVLDIGFLSGKRSSGGSRLPLQGHVSNVVANYVKTKLRAHYRKKWLSNIIIDDELLGNWVKV